MTEGVVVVADGTVPLAREVAKLAAQRGFGVVLNAPSGASLSAAEEAAAEIRALGGTALATNCDIETADGAERLLAAGDGLGRVIGLVNNASLVPAAGRLDQVDAADLVRLFSANITASFLCAGAAIRRMSRKQGGTGGSIVNVSSPASRHGSPGHSVAYAAAKGAIDSFTNGLSMEVAREGVRVNTVRVALSPADELLPSASPMIVDVAALAAPILWLMSDEAEYCHGIHLAVTGGRWISA